MIRKHLLPVAVVGVTAVVLAACGGGSYGGSASSSSGKPASPSPAGAVRTAKTSLGTVLVDGRGLTLYRFTKDTGPSSTCSGACASNWPPLTAKSMPKAGGGIQASALSLVKRGDGSRQVLLDGHPLYFYAGDAAAGDVNGQNLDAFGGKWSVVSPAGANITAQASSTASTSSGRSNYGY